MADPRALGWLTLSLAIALAYSLPALGEAFSTPFIIQDDARQHVFWMQRFMNPELFPNDLIADYFQTVAPAGYAALYRVVAWMGIDPILFHKILPVSLSLVTAGYCFSVCLSLLPVPTAAFMASVLLMQGLGLTDAIVSATPKAFVYPLILAFLDALLRRNLWLTMGAIALQGLFYPQLVLLSSGVLVLRLLQWQPKSGAESPDQPMQRPFRGPGIPKLRIPKNWGDRRFVLAGLTVSFFILLPYLLQSNAFGPTLTAAEARQLPELSIPGSRARFFYDDEPITFWLNRRSGLRLATALTPVTNALGLLLPLLMILSGRLRGLQHTVLQRLDSGIAILPNVFISSLVWFGIAHLTLFRLHLPSRYTQHSFRVVFSLAAAIAIVAIIDGLFRWALTKPPLLEAAHFPKLFSLRGVVAVLVSGGLGIAVLAYPAFVSEFPMTAYQVGNFPELYGFLRSQPNTTLIASLSEEANNLPSFAQRSVLVAREYAIPYHTGYYTPFRQRIRDVAVAQYSPEIDTVQTVIEQYGITHWLLDRPAFTPSYTQNRLWIRQYPDIFDDALKPLQDSDRSPVLKRRLEPCTVFRQQSLILLDAQCLTAAKEN